MAAANPMRLSVIIPAYNEEQRLPETLRSVGDYLAAQSYDSEVIVVDDGSTDRTAAAVSAGTGIRSLRLLCHPDHANHGKGAAVRLGMLAAEGAFRLFMDADNSTTLNQVEDFWSWLEGGYDIVIGSRKKAGARVNVHQARYKELAGRFGNLVIRRLAVPDIEDTQAGFKIFTGNSAAEIFSRQTIDRWGYDVASPPVLLTEHGAAAAGQHPGALGPEQLGEHPALDGPEPLFALLGEDLLDGPARGVLHLSVQVEDAPPLPPGESLGHGALPGTHEPHEDQAQMLLMLRGRAQALITCT
jgi:dolichyl-phosphate beta-glucosyltransferase